MFIIVPKRRKRGSTSSPGPSSSGHAERVAERTTGTEVPPETATTCAAVDDRGPVRSSTACDACRVRKTKCNGLEPCGRCLQRHIICVYSRPTHRDLPTSASQVALLQHQQRRLYAAVKQMAAVIARQEGGPERTPESFDVLQLLQQYAPDHTIRDPSMPSESPPAASARIGKRTSASTLPQSSTRKRARRGETGAESAAEVGHAFSTVHEPSRSDASFELRPNPSVSDATPAEWSESYQAMMQFLLSTEGVGTAARNSTLVPPVAPLESSSSITQNVASAGSSVPNLPVSPTQQFLDLVDWDASLQYFQNSHDTTLLAPNMPLSTGSSLAENATPNLDTNHQM